MSTTVTTTPAAVGRASGPAVFLDVLRSEWTKLRTLRSTYWSALAAVVISIGIGALVCAANGSHGNDVTDPAGLSLAGLFLAQIAFAIVGVLAMSAEYTSGMIRTTICAVPQRGYVLAGKALVVGVAGLVLALLTSFASFWAGQAILSRHQLNIGLGAPGVLRAVVGAGLYTFVLVVLAMMLATLLRNTAGTITAIVGIVFVLPAVAAALPLRWQNDIGRFLPANAGGAIVSVTRSLGPWAGFGVFCLWAAAAAVAAWWVLNHRDV
jgi:ABC-2 type transport system permease protein